MFFCHTNTDFLFVFQKMNKRDDITMDFENTETHEKKKITLAYLETGPNHHNHHFLQLWIALKYITNNDLIDYEFDKDLLVVGTPEHKWYLDTTLKDYGEMNVRKILEVFVTYFYADKTS